MDAPEPMLKFGGSWKAMSPDDGSAPQQGNGFRVLSESCFTERCSDTAQVSVNVLSPLDCSSQPGLKSTPSFRGEWMIDVSGLTLQPRKWLGRLLRLHPTAVQTANVTCWTAILIAQGAEKSRNTLWAPDSLKKYPNPVIEYHRLLSPIIHWVCPGLNTG